MIKWIDPENALVLENMDDINYYKQQGLLDVGMARPMNSDHIVNCPFIDPFQQSFFTYFKSPFHIV